MANIKLGGTVVASESGGTVAIDSGVTFPTGHVIQTVGNTDDTTRSIAVPDNIAVEGVRVTITSTVANSNFFINGNSNQQSQQGHAGNGICLNGLVLPTNLIWTASHADGSGTGNMGWYGWYMSGTGSGTTARYLTSAQHFYDPGNHAIGTDFTFYLVAMGYAHAFEIVINQTHARNAASSITVMEIAP